MLAGEKHIRQVDVELLMPVILAQRNRTAWQWPADVVDENIDGAVLCETRVHEHRDLSAIGDIRDMRREFATEFADHVGSLGHGIGILVDSKHLRPFLGKTHGDRATISPTGADATGTDDDRNFVLKSEFGGIHGLAVSCRLTGIFAFYA